MQNPAQETRDRPCLRLSAVVAPLSALGFPSVLAGYLPSRHWIIDLPACFQVQAGTALLLGAIVLLLGRRRWLGLLWLAGFLAAALTVAPGWAAAAGRRTNEGAPLELLVVNLLRGNETNSEQALALILRADADVVFLSELTPAWSAALEHGLTAYPYREVTEDPGYFGIALYSKLPLRAVETIPLAYDWAPAIRAIVDTSAGAIGLLGVHTPRPGQGDRCVERDAALAAIPAAMAALPPRRVVTGDFNATPWNRAFRELLEATGLHHASGDTFRPTWPTMYPWPFRVPIDHVLVSDGIGVEHVTVGEPFGSDHAPLEARLRL